MKKIAILTALCLNLLPYIVDGKLEIMSMSVMKAQSFGDEVVCEDEFGSYASNFGNCDDESCTTACRFCGASMACEDFYFHNCGPCEVYCSLCSSTISCEAYATHNCSDSHSDNNWSEGDGDGDGGSGGSGGGIGGGIVVHENPNAIALKIVETTKSYVDNDERSYGANPPNVDCSMFSQEVASKNGKTIPRTTNSQIDWFKANGEWITDVSDLQAGDYVFWSRGIDKYHVGIIVQITPKISVVHVHVNRNQPGAIKETPMQESDGQVPYFNQPFVGGGRF